MHRFLDFEVTSNILAFFMVLARLVREKFGLSKKDFFWYNKKIKININL